MANLTKYFIDLSKLSEEQIKALVPILEDAGYHVYFEDRIFLKNGKYDRPYFHLFNSKSWLSSSILVMKQELTYPEFIKLFEGGEGENENIYDVDFGGNVMARIKIVDNKIEVTNAMNGYGNGIPLSEITITNSNQ